MHDSDEDRLLGPREFASDERELPWWVRIAAGVAIALFALLCGIGSLSMLLAPNQKAPALTIILGVVLTLGCIWVYEKCFRLITGRKNRGGLMSPNTLRAVALFWLILPIAALLTGYYRQMGAVAVVQAAIHVSGFLGLLALARRREVEWSRHEERRVGEGPEPIEM